METAQNILDLPVSKARTLFSGSADDIRSKFKAYAHSWHPDRSKDPQSGAVFAHLLALRDRALAHSGADVSSLSKVFTAPDKKTFKMKVLFSRPVDLGQFHVGPHSFVFEYTKGFCDLAAAERSRVESFKFADSAMQAEMSKFLPSLVASAPLIEGDLNIFQRKDNDVMLEDLIAKLGRLRVEDAAWVVSGMLNIACYLSWAGLVHGAISPQTVAIDPERHSVKLIGGWGFSVKEGVRPSHLPARTLAAYPGIAAKSAKATFLMDLELIRKTAKDMLGLSTRAAMLAAKVPPSLVDWITMDVPKTAIADYASWRKAVEAAYPKKAFVTFQDGWREIY